MYFFMKSSRRKIVMMMTVENIHGREILSNLIDYKFPIDAVIVEHKSKLAENTLNYLKNDFYNPKPFSELVKGVPINVHYVEHHNEFESIELLKKYQPDYVVLGGTRILKEPVIRTAKFGILNSHPAILPKYHGLDCVAWSILNKDPVGATVHYIDPGIDSGPIILQESIDYSDCHSLIEVRIKAMRKCAELIVKSLIGLEFGTLKPQPQDTSLAIKHPAMSPDKVAQVEKILSNQK